MTETETVTDREAFFGSRDSDRHDDRDSESDRDSNKDCDRENTVEQGSHNWLDGHPLFIPMII